MTYADGKATEKVFLKLAFPRSLRVVILLRVSSMKRVLISTIMRIRKDSGKDGKNGREDKISIKTNNLDRIQNV